MSTVNKGRKIWYGWWIVLAGSIINGIGGGINWYGFTVFFLPLRRDLSISYAQTSLIFSASRLEAGFLGPITGWLIDRFGPKLLVIIGASLTGTGYLLLSRSTTFWSVFILYVFVISLGYNGGFYLCITTTINNWFIRLRSIAMGIVFAANGVGGAIIVPILGILVAEVGWRFAAVVAGGIILIIVPALAFVLRQSPESIGLMPDGYSNPQKDMQPEAKTMSNNNFLPGQAIRTKAFWLTAVAILLRMTTTMGLMVHLVPILVWKGISEPTAAYLVSFQALACVPLFLALGWLGLKMSKTTLCALGAISAIIGCLGLLFLPTSLGVFLFLLGLIILTSSIVNNWTVVGDFFGRTHFATIQGMMAPLHSLGGFIAPIYLGWSFDTTGGYFDSILVTTVALLMSSVLFFILKPPVLPTNTSRLTSSKL